MTAGTVAATTELPAHDLGPYTPAQTRFAIEAWPLRAAQELRSARIFRALALAARAAAVPEPWPSRFADAMRDELRHARLCATVGGRLGATKPRYDGSPVRARLAATKNDAWSRTLALLVGEVAIGETISVCLFRTSRKAAIEPLSRAALGLITVDEARHARLGWSALTSLWPRLTEAQRAEAQREAARGLAGCEQQNARPAMAWLQGKRFFDPAYAALGVIDPEVRIETFYWAVEQLVVPRLTKLGLDGAQAWASRYREGAAG
jgi:hypothetical protein